MSLPTLDLEHVELPLPLRPVTQTLDAEVAGRAVGGLGAAARATRRLVESGVVPPQAVTANTVDLGFRNYDLVGGIYLREQVTYCRPLLIGETLRIEGEVTATYVRNGRRRRIMSSRSLDERGQVAVISRSTGVVQFQPAHDLEVDEPEPSLAPAYPSGGEHARQNPSRERLLQLADNWVVEGMPEEVTLAMMVANAGKADRNPIHTDAQVAERAGLDAPIAGGPHVLSFVQELLMRELGLQVLLYGSHFDVRWISPVRVGSLVRARARLRRKVELEAVLDLEVHCNDRKAMLGECRIPLSA